MKALINEIREYVNQENSINKTNESLEHAMDMRRDYTSGKEEQAQVDLLESRLDYQELKLCKFIKISCEAFNITVNYFIGCVNQYTEVLSYDKV